MDPSAGVDGSHSGDTPGRAPVGVDESDGHHRASVGAVVRERFGREREVLPGRAHQPLVGGERGGLSARVCQGEDGDGSLPGAGREVVLGGFDGEGAVGESLPQDDPGDCGVPDRLAGCGVKDDDMCAQISCRLSRLLLGGKKDQ